MTPAENARGRPHPLLFTCDLSRHHESFIIVAPAALFLDIDIRIAEAVGDARVAAGEAAHAATQAATLAMTAQM